MQYTVIEFFQSETEKERRRNLEFLLQQLRLTNGPKDGGTDAPRKGWLAVYCRLSKEDEEKTARESESIRNQRALLLAWAAEHGYRIYRVYTDEDYSALTVRGPSSTRCWPTRGRQI